MTEEPRTMLIPDPTDQEVDGWIVRILDGDVEATRLLYRRFARPLFALVWNRVRPRHHDAEEVAQEIWVEAWRHLDRFDRSRSFWAWLCGIARRKLARFHRDRSRSKVHGMLGSVATNLEADRPLPQELLEERESGQAIMAVLGGLEPRDRDLLKLKYGESRSTREIAAALQSTPEAVNSALARARTAFKERFRVLVRSGSWKEQASWKEKSR